MGVTKKKSKGKPQAASLDLQRADSGLTILQEVVAAEMCTGASITAIAKKHKITRETIYDWLRDRRFDAYRKALLAEVRQEVRGALSSMAAEATSTLRMLMNGGGEQARLKAATYVIDRLNDDDKRVAKAKTANDGSKKG